MKISNITKRTWGILGVLSVAAIATAATFSNTYFGAVTLATINLAVSNAANTFSATITAEPTAARALVLPDYSGTILSTGRASQQYSFTIGAPGATSGWVGIGGSNTQASTLPAGETGSTLVIPVGLHVGDIITAFTVRGQVESAGNTATLDASLFKLTGAAGDLVSVDIGAIAQVSVTADAIVNASKTLVSPETVGADESFFVLLTGTTAASTDFAIQGVLITVTGN
jgi:hypothetical protein